jgi:hypothetical protein
MEVRAALPPGAVRPIVPGLDRDHGGGRASTTSPGFEPTADENVLAREVTRVGIGLGWGRASTRAKASGVHRGCPPALKPFHLIRRKKPFRL